MFDTAKVRDIVVKTIEVRCTFDFFNSLKISKKTFLWMYIFKNGSEKEG